ncbi:MAG TPA: FkbM family methyltransferase [Methylocella sp.]|nr:FkbM family methyltransferase [Methylocella sp.]
MNKRAVAFIADCFPLIERLTNDRLIITLRRHLNALAEQDILKKLIKYFAIDCVFDVGANTGQYATMLRKKVGYKGLIISFEPIPKCANQLRRLAASDPLWHVEQVALADKSDVATFNVMKDSQFSSLLVPDNGPTSDINNWNKVAESIQVTVVTISEIYEDLQKRFRFSRPFLKMDTQGSELKVALGAGEKIKSFVALQSELSIINIYKESKNYIEAIKFYESQGFRLSAFVPNNPGHFPKLIETDCVMYNQSFYTKDIEAKVLADRI